MKSELGSMKVKKDQYQPECQDNEFYDDDE